MASFDVDSTPNPNSLKFTVRGQTLLDGGVLTLQPGDAETDHPLADLLSIAGVCDLFITPSFLTVSKEEEADWSDVRPQIESLLQEHLDDAA